MADLVFRVSPNIILGEYTSSRLSDYAGALINDARERGNASQPRQSDARYIVVIDPALSDTEVAQKVLAGMVDKGINYFVMNEIGESAETKTIERTLSLARDGYATGVIAIGGTKALSIGAAVAALHGESGGIYDFLNSAVITHPPLPLISLPTTIRYGFLFSSYVPVVDSRRHRARFIKSPNALCKLALIDPTLTSSLSEEQFTSMSLETLSLAVEAYLSQRATFFSDMLVEKAMELLRITMKGTALGAVANPATIKSQAGCMVSLAMATCSGGLGIMLSLCINAYFGIQRSLVSAAFLPYLIEDALKFKADRVARLARLLGVADASTDDTTAAQMLADDVRQQVSQAGLPSRLHDLSLTMEQLAPVVDNIMQLDFVTMLPRSMTAEDIFDLIKTAY